MTALMIKMPGRVVSVNLVDPSQAKSEPAPAMDEAEIKRRVEQMLAEPRKELESAIASMREAATQLRELTSQLSGQIESQVLDLAIGIAQKVLMHNIDKGQYQIDTIIRQALDRLNTRQCVTVRLNPRDIGNCKLASDQPEGAGSLSFVADANMQPGGCFVECPEGFIDFQVQSQLEAVAASLREST